MSDAPRPEPTLRRLRPDDFEVVAGFEREIARISFPEDPVTDLGFHVRRLEKALMEREAAPVVAVDADGRVVGWAWVGVRENFATKARYGDFRSLYVAPEARAAGVAFALMREVLRFCAAHRLTAVVGRTSATNEAMAAVYELYGFRAKHVVYELALTPAAPGDREARADPGPRGEDPARAPRPDAPPSATPRAGGTPSRDRRDTRRP